MQRAVIKGSLFKIIDFLDNRLTGGERAESGGTGGPWDQWSTGNCQQQMAPADTEAAFS